MNKIYKLIWSKVRNAWVVTSEIAKGHGKESSSGRNGKRLKLAVMTAILGGCFMTAGISPVDAALTQEQQDVYDAVMAKLNEDGVKKIHYLSIGPDNEKDLAHGGNYNNDGVEQHWGIAIGVNASSKDGDGIAMGMDSRSRGNQSIGLGSLSSAVGTYSTSVGHRSQAFGYSASAYGALARAYGANGVALGAGALVANSKALTKAEYDALTEEEKALYHTEIKQSDYYQYKQKTDSGKIEDIEVNGVAIGNYASSIGFGGVAIGDRAKASDKDNIENSKWGVALGASSQNKVDQGVALGASSVADRAEKVKGYLPTTGKSIKYFEDAMEATGKAEAFNQFKKDYVAATAKLNEAKTAYEANTTDDTLKAAFEEAKKKVEDLKGQYAVMTAPWTSRRGAVSVGNDKTGFTRQLTGLAAGSEDTDAVNVAQLKALNTKVDQGAIHYYSVTSDKKAAGSNYDNDGAKGTDSMVIGIGSISEAQNSTVLGNNNTLKRYHKDRTRTGSLSLNNIVAGQNLEVEGAYNAVFGTDYQNNLENRKTMVAGKYNTVIGVGNLAGYTAEKDPQDRFKWIYKKVEENGSDSNNVVVGMNNTATRSSIVIGADSEASSLGTSVGSNNKIVGDGNYGLALGNDLTVNGEQAIAIGSGSKATANYATAIGRGAIASQESSIAFGRSAKAQKEGSVAIGSFSRAERDKEVYGYNPLTKTAYDDASIGAMYDPSKVKELEKYTETIAQKTQERDEADRRYNELFDQYEDMLDGKGNIPDTKENREKLGKELDKAQDALDNAKEALATAQKQKTKITAPYQSSEAAVAVGNEKTGITRQITGVAAGSEDTDAVNVAQLKALNNKVDQGADNIIELQKGWTLGVARGDDSETDADATAVGENAKVSAGDKVTLKAGRGIKLKQDGTNVQIGLKFIDMNPAGYPFNDAKATGAGSLAVGQNSVAKAHQATAVGLDTEADQYGVALGTTSKAGSGAVAIGSRAFANGDDSIAIGGGKRNVEKDPTKGYRKIDSKYAIAIGASAAIGEKSEASSAVGYYAEIAQSEWSSAFGGYSKIENSKYASTLGAASKVENAAFGTALGGYSEVQGSEYGTSLGTSSRVQRSDYGTALGSNAAVIGAEGGVAIGAYSVADRSKASMMGYNPAGDQWNNVKDYLEKTGQTDAFKQASAKVQAAYQAWEKDKKNPELLANYYQARAEQSKMISTWTGLQGAVSIGDEREGLTRQLTGLAAGTKDTDAVNVAQLKALNTKVDNGAIHYVSVTAIDKSQTADSNYFNDGAKGDGGIAIGQGATSQGRGIAMGYKSSATPKEGATLNLNSFEGIAIGQEAHMEVPGGIALGLRSKVEGTLNTKDGNVNELGTIALGTDSYAKGLGAAAFGWKAEGIGEGAMAFGTKTKAKESGTAFGAHANAAAGAVAMGWQANANDFVATSVGTSSDAGKQATAVGAAASATGRASTAVGLGSTSKGLQSTTIGALSVAEENGSVALGAGAVANTKAGEIGYVATGGSATFEEALATLDKKEDYDKWTATVNASKAEYDNLTKAFNDASKDKKDEAKQALDDWKVQHADFVKALTAKEKLEATWKATEAAVSVGADGVDKAGNRIIKSRQITNVAAGTRDTDAVNVAQLRNLATAPMNFYFGGKKEGNTYTPGNTNWSMPLNEFRMDFGDGLKAEQVTDQDGKKYTLVTLDKESLKNDPDFKGPKGDQGLQGETGPKGDKGDQGKSAYDIWKEKPGNDAKSEDDFLTSLKGKDGKDGKNGTGSGGVSIEAGKNITVDKKDTTKTVVSLKDNIDVKSVKVGDVTIKDNKITGIAPGEISKDSKDAVNGSQLFATNQQVANNMYQINNLRDESREGDALGAAMAALKPIDFDPYQRSQIMAGVGYYRGKEAVALGLAHYKNEDLMFHGGLAYAGNSELMANIGVTYRFGSKDDRDIKHDRNLRMPQYAEGPISSVYILQDEVERLTKENKEANDRIAALEAKLEKVLEKVK